MPELTETAGIVVLGSMNPAIHHPAWYKWEGILTPEEYDDAQKRDLVCSQPFSQFLGFGVSVTCSSDRWQILTSDPSKFGRILEIACRTFEILTHTPVGAFGINLQFQREAGVPHVGRHLSILVNRLPIGRETTDTDSAQITTTAAIGDAAITEVLGVAQGADNVLQVAFNLHHPIKTEGTQYVQFDLTPLLKKVWDEGYPACKRRADRIAIALTESKGG
jgi:hypothetical protein